MSKHLLAIIEVDEYPSDKIVHLLNNDSLRESINDTFFGYIDNPSDYNYFCFSTGPFNDNCVMVHFKEVSDDAENIEDSDTESVLNVIAELNRNVYLYLINSSDFKLIEENSGARRFFSDISPFPILDIKSSCIDAGDFK
jgi:hypothetical protein